MKDALISQILLPSLAMIVTAFVGFGVTKFTQWTGIQVEAKHREALHSAIMTGIGLAVARAGIVIPRPTDVQPSTLEPIPPTTQKKIVAEAMNYVQHSVPDALKNFNLDKKPDVLADMIVGKAGSVIGGLLQNLVK